MSGDRLHTEQVPQAAVFGLIGGMGSGKSTVGRELAEHGAVVIDADEVVRELSQPGELGFLAMVGILGEGVVADNGKLDTKRIASLIFDDRALRDEVEQATHPLVYDRMFETARKLSEKDIAVFEIPLLDTEHALDMNGVVAVVTPIRLAIERLSGRGFTPEQARERISAQMSNAERVAMADFVITNNGSLPDLRSATDQAWKWMGEVIPPRRAS